ncbi:type I-PGING CRISPR-associated protein Cas8c/Csp2 [Prevotella sp.]|uniref:type I-PGING CRISPR-associated protein Cas8c/Csp2 n=1 Tax=Prevotella sp. TaxID=59823 RepID=UPI0025E68CBD|nr:type I-PGING CRISPR-associated protein Cas8c/Csp2 [Prevotella sp.]
MTTHVYLKYAIALLMEEYGLQTEQDITFKEIKGELIKGLNAFSVKPIGDYCGQTEVKFGFVDDKNDSKNYIYLSPNIIASERKGLKKGSDSILYKKVCEICSTNDLNLSKTCDILKSLAPTAGEYCYFSDKGEINRRSPRVSFLENCLVMITTTTALKPCLLYYMGKGKSISADNTCLIPDLDLSDLRNFIRLFKRIRIQKLDSSLMVGKVECDEKTLKYIPKRPNIFNGNFPNAPHSSALGSVALLGSIGEMTKEIDVSELAKKVLESLKDCNFYAIKYGDASVFSFNHSIIRLAERGKLRRIVDSLYYVVLYKEGRRSTNNAFEYQKFDLFASRFLQIFNRPTFKDFLAFRAEYPYDIELLLNTYFCDMEKIDKEIVTSAKELGKWLNYVAYRSAQQEVGTSSGWDDLIKAKAKILVELESSVFSAKSGDALIAYTITRAGRLSGFDAPTEASLFMEKAASGELPLEQAKNLLIAFSRLKSKKEEADKAYSNDNQSIKNENEEMTEDYSNI